MIISYKTFLFLALNVITFLFAIGCSDNEPTYWGDKALVDKFGEIDSSMISSISVAFPQSRSDIILIDNSCWDEFLAIVSSFKPPGEIGVGEWQHHEIVFMATNAGESFSFTVGTRKSLPGETIIIVQGGREEFDHLAFFVGAELVTWLRISRICFGSENFNKTDTKVPE